MQKVHYELEIVGLIFAAVTSILRGVSCFPSVTASLPSALVRLTTRGLPIQVWGVLWCLSGLLLIVSLFLLRSNHSKYWSQDLVILGALGLYLAWGLAYYMNFVISLIHQHRSEDYLPAFQYLTICIIGLVIWARWIEVRRTR